VAEEADVSDDVKAEAEVKFAAMGACADEGGDVETLAPSEKPDSEWDEQLLSGIYTKFNKGTTGQPITWACAGDGA
jgi:hypothetical protein